MALSTPLKSELVAKAALSVISEQSALLPNVTKQEVSNLGTGDSPYIYIRHPAEFTVRQSRTWAGAAVVERKTPLALTKIYGVDFEFSDSDMALTIQDFDARYIQPAIKRIIAAVESDFYKDVLAQAGSFVSGTAATALDDLFKVEENLNLRSADFGSRVLIANPRILTGVMKQGRGLFQEASEIGKQYKAGVAGMIAGFEVYGSSRIPASIDNAAIDKTAVTVTFSQGSDILNITTLVNTGLKGQVFTIAGMYDVNPETKESTGELKQFVVKGVTTVGGDYDTLPATSVVIPFPIYTSGSSKNVFLSTDGITEISEATFEGATRNVVGLGANAKPQAVGFDKNAIVMGCVKLEVPGGNDKAASYSEDGLNIRYVRWFDESIATWKGRFDIQIGWVVPRPEHVVAWQQVS